MHAAGQHGRAVPDGVLDVLDDGRQLRGGGQRAHVRAVVEPGPEAQLAGAPDERRGELVGHVLVHVDPLDAHADLPGADEARAHGPLGGDLDVHVLRDVHRVLAAELEGGRHQPLPRLRGDDPARARRPGEAHVVDVLDDGRADRRPVADDHLQQPVGQPGLLQQLGGPQRGERRLRVGPQDDGVAGDQRGQHVAERERQREVPGRDDADDADGVPQHARRRQAGDQARDAARREVATGARGVVPRDDARCRRPPRTPRRAPCRTRAG